MTECLFCEREFEAKNKNHKFCSYNCRYCYHRADGTNWEGMSRRERVLTVSGAKLSPRELEIDKRKRPDMYKPKPEKKVELVTFEPKPQPKKKPWTRRDKQDDYDGRCGYVYLMKSENGLYKIGRAKDVETRRTGIERDVPMKVRIIHTIKSNNYIEAEKHLHKVYDEQRLRYEWFELSPQQAEEIMQIKPFGIDAELSNQF